MNMGDNFQLVFLRDLSISRRINNWFHGAGCVLLYFRESGGKRWLSLVGMLRDIPWDAAVPLIWYIDTSVWLCFDFCWIVGWLGMYHGTERAIICSLDPNSLQEFYHCFSYDDFVFVKYAHTFIVTQFTDLIDTEVKSREYFCMFCLFW